MNPQLSVKKGRFITLEGGEGVGKTTNMAFIEGYLTERGIDVLVTREPGGTPLSEAIREMLLDKQYKGMHADTELLLMFAARAEHIHRKILPALQQGTWVLSDRFTDASFAYQGAGRELGFARIEILEAYVQNGFQPDLTLLLDAEVELGMERVDQRAEKDRFENEQLAFFRRVRQGYLQRASEHPERLKLVNAMQTLSEVQAELAAHLDRLLDERG
ncbi:MAG: dTMP kinase [Gammaproteobacteria bacterium]|nr:dTMP kinase [Gammaproteobacteria bacterium]